MNNFATGICPPDYFLSQFRKPRQVWFAGTDLKVKTRFPVSPIDEPEKAGKQKSYQQQIVDAVASAKHNTHMKPLHLVTAILARIAHFHALKTDFSAYDITTSLREKVATGEYDIVDVRKDYFGGALLAVVKHDAVRDIVNELFGLDMIPNYSATNHFNSLRGVSYVVYRHGQNATIQRPTASVPTPAPVASPAPTAQFTNSAAQPQTVAASQPNTDMWAKAVSYVQNKKLLGQSPTLKQVQSRLKGYSVTCNEIYNFLKQKGYSFVRPTQNISEAEVR